MGLFDFLFGSKGKRENISTLRDEQLPLYQQLIGAGMGRGAGGAFGQSADYYRSLLDNDPQALEAFMAPEMRRFREQISPDIAEQFAGMGAGGLSSSGFQNAQTAAATDLAERLARLRAGLRESAASGLSNIGSMGLGRFSENIMTEQPTQGLLPGIFGAAGNAFGGPFGQAAGQGLGNWFTNRFGPQFQSPNASPPS